MADSLEGPKFQMNVGTSGIERAFAAAQGTPLFGNSSVKPSSENENDKISLTFAGRAAATGMKAVNPLVSGAYKLSDLGTAKDESTAESADETKKEDEKSDEQKRIEEQLKKIKEEIAKLQEEIAEIEKMPDSQQKKVLLAGKQSQISSLQEQSLDLQKMMSEEVGGDLYSALRAKGGITNLS